MADPIRSLKNVMKKIKDATNSAVTAEQLIPVGEFAVGIIVKRTRLGYGVDTQFGAKKALKALSNPYKEFRKGFSGLDNRTTPSKSNLTLTGQLLDSVKLIRAQNGRVVFGPTGVRRGGTLTNLRVAAYQEGQGRRFNRISDLEYKQTLRFYRRQFGDLLRRKRLIT